MKIRFIVSTTMRHFIARQIVRRTNRQMDLNTRSQCGEQRAIDLDPEVSDCAFSGVRDPEARARP
jgi:hypothetical protein